MGGTIGFFVGAFLLFVLSTILSRDMARVIINPLTFMVFVMFCIFIGNAIEDRGKISGKEIAQAAKSSGIISFQWFAVFIGIGVVCWVVFGLVPDMFQRLPSNY